VKNNDKLGVCLDTCHVFAGGYDIGNQPEEVLKDFDEIIGLDRLYAVHLNDSLMPFNSHKDRHAKIGEGEIGAEALVKFVAYPEIVRLPIILETPNDLAGYANEIAFLKNATQRNF
jgi:deoxyribonuclease-4